MPGSVGMQCKVLYCTHSAVTDYTSITHHTSIGQLTSVSPSITGGEADVSHADLTTLYEEYVPTLAGVQITGEVVFDPGTSLHEVNLIDQVLVDQSWAVQFYDNASATATNNSIWFGRGFLRDVDISGGIREPFTASIAIRLSGMPTFKGV